MTKHEHRLQPNLKQANLLQLLLLFWIISFGQLLFWTVHNNGSFRKLNSVWYIAQRSVSVFPFKIHRIYSGFKPAPRSCFTLYFTVAKLNKINFKSIIFKCWLYIIKYLLSCMVSSGRKLSRRIKKNCNLVWTWCFKGNLFEYERRYEYYYNKGSACTEISWNFANV